MISLLLAAEWFFRKTKISEQKEKSFHSQGDLMGVAASESPFVLEMEQV